MHFRMTALHSSIESLLFISGAPVSYAKLSKTLQAEMPVLREAVRELADKYAQDVSCGLMLIINENEVVMATKAENAANVEAFTKSSLEESLSRAALEVLSIIAYRAPITRAEIEAIRGVNCSFTLRNLLLRDLVDRSGNPLDARGYVYRPSFHLLETLGIAGVEKLPDYETLSQDERLTMILEGEQDAADETPDHETKI